MIAEAQAAAQAAKAAAAWAAAATPSTSAGSWPWAAAATPGATGIAVEGDSLGAGLKKKRRARKPTQPLEAAAGKLQPVGLEARVRARVRVR
eukprot:scaffold30994_cov42-Phaeocystis_antarctica.AAC.1